MCISKAGAKSVINLVSIINKATGVPHDTQIVYHAFLDFVP